MDDVTVVTHLGRSHGWRWCGWGGQGPTGHVSQWPRPAPPRPPHTPSRVSLYTCWRNLYRMGPGGSPGASALHSTQLNSTQLNSPVSYTLQTKQHSVEVCASVPAQVRLAELLSLRITGVLNTPGCYSSHLYSLNEFGDEWKSLQSITAADMTELLPLTTLGVSVSRYSNTFTSSFLMCQD
ncbi:hypothetical protein Pmani_015094 [Petrolisthes manimaculis]|uniref:Uncharacterized protein n=1 Tax=Petrolisthes manimaculis TaxID=1843537 RepID=A0AAE1U805_9EUCA|nr:hypothetical protein Pmani_015094 [Petrolisthes manimaculis]